MMLEGTLGKICGRDKENYSVKDLLGSRQSYSSHTHLWKKAGSIIFRLKPPLLARLRVIRDLPGSKETKEPWANPSFNLFFSIVFPTTPRAMIVHENIFHLEKPARKKTAPVNVTKLIEFICKNCTFILSTQRLQSNISMLNLHGGANFRPARTYYIAFFTQKNLLSAVCWHLKEIGLL